MLPPGKTTQAIKMRKRQRPTPRYSQEDYPAQVWELQLGAPSPEDLSSTVLTPQFWDDLFWEAHGSECLWSVTYAGDRTAIQCLCTGASVHGAAG